MSHPGHPRHTVITLLPTGLDVSHRGRCQRIELDPSVWEQAWREQLKPLDSTLTSTLARLGVKQGSAIVIHQSPEVLSDVVAVNSTGRDALDAAMLAVAQGGGSSARLDAAEALGIDVQTPRTHVLAASESIAAAEMVASWLGRAGMTLAGLIPARAAAIHHAAMLATASNELNSLFVCIGEVVSGVAAGSSGKLAFARAMEFGIGQLAAVYLTAMRRDPAGPAERAAARELALRFGVPDREASIDAAAGLTGARVLPLLQPVLQRLLVELKQTVRFGLPNGNMREAKIVLAGQASALPGLQELINTQLECATRVESTDGWEGTWALGASALTITPPTVQERRLGTALSRALVAGVVLAGGVILGDAAMTRNTIETVRQRSAEIGPQVHDVEERMRRIEQAGRVAEQVRATQGQLTLSLNNRAPIRALLFEITRLTPHGVQLSEISWAPPPSQAKPDYAATVTLRGLAPKAAGQDSLGSLIEALKACPMVSSVAIGSTRILAHDTGTFQQFTVTARVRGVPPASLAALAGASK